VKLSQGKGYHLVNGQVEVKSGNLVKLAKNAKAKLIARNGAEQYLKPGKVTRIIDRSCVRKGPKVADESASELGCGGNKSDPGGIGDLGGIGGIGGIGGFGALAAAGAIIGAGVGAGVSTANSGSQNSNQNALSALLLQQFNPKPVSQ
jgi:hypothetical protein